MRLIWFNWRDIKHPEHGGAEVFTHEVIRRLEKKGYVITLFSERFPGSVQEDYIDGVRIYRDGGRYSVYRKAREFYLKNKNNYDFVIDEINAKPFLTPGYVKNHPVLAITHHVSLEAWCLELPFPLGHIGYYLCERHGLSHYKNIPTVTVSESNKKNLEKIGLKKVYVVPEGINAIALDKIVQKQPPPVFVFVGRLKRNKLPDHAIKAYSLIKERIPSARMWVVGDGYMRKKLEQNTDGSVTFYGHVEEQLKLDLMRKAHLILVPGVHEGWGLVVTESNAMGTPAIAYNVPGLKDSIIDNKTGILVRKNSPKDMAMHAISLISDTGRLAQLSKNALDFSRQFSWDNTADAFDKIIQTTYDEFSSTSVNRYK
jgi:glycosyltransferase involved in cell wall biosynthesis